VRDTLSVKTDIHGRVLIEGAAVSVSRGVLIVFHGYAQQAEDAFSAVKGVPGIEDWLIVAPQALHRFYLHGGRTPDDPVVGSWMTRQDREVAIMDALAYVDRIIDRLVGPQARDVPSPTSETYGANEPRIVFAGFSQGASMAYRAGILGRHRAAGIVALGGDIPPEVKPAPSISWPPVLIGAGSEDSWYSVPKVAADRAWLTAHGVTYTIARYRGGHEWTDEFKRAMGAFLARC
jgi:predicted esterase